jgi:protein associated with RNAse G/E
LSEITVYKLDEEATEVWRYKAVVLERQPTSVRLVATFNRDDLDLGFTLFKRGDRFVETFYSDRWYNVFAVYDRDDHKLKGWYCNICRPAHLGATAVHCEDLALDMWVSAIYQIQILDEDEFASLDLSPEERQKCLSALQELTRLAQLQQLPC